MSDKFRSEVMSITPLQAQKWLDEKAPNRSIKEGKVFQFAADMEAGLWRLTHQGIAFDPDGNLTDGQHRLEAITLARKPVTMMVTYGVAREATMVFDQGTARTLCDNIEIATGKHVHPKVVSCAMALLTARPGSRRQQSADVVNKVIEKHAVAMETVAMPLITARAQGPSSGLVCAAFVRAHYHLPANRLRELIAALISGMVDDPEKDGAAIRLRDYLKSPTGKFESRSTPVVYLYRVERAIKAFCVGEPWGRMVAATEEMYPLPGEGKPEVEGITTKAHRAKQRAHAASVVTLAAQKAEARRGTVLEAKRLRKQNVPLRQIAETLKIGRGTVRNYLRENVAESR